MQRKDWLLLLLATRDSDNAPPPAVDRVRAMKCLFVAGERFPELKAGQFYQFEPYNYGPFDSSVYHDAEELIGEGLVESTYQSAYVAYRATAEGEARAVEAVRQFPSIAQHLAQLRTWATRVSFSSLLKEIYAQWPEYKKNSVFFG